MHTNIYGKTENTYLCTRARLATLLMSKGFECKRLPSPFRDGFYVWEFEASDELMEIVSDFFFKNDYKRWQGRQSKGGDAD